MSEYEVYHVSELEMPVRYVATVEASGLENLWRLTNNVNESWTDNPEVKNLAAKDKARNGSRSLMVGDVAYSFEDKKHYRVADFGWEEVDPFAKDFDYISYDCFGENREFKLGCLADLLNGEGCFG